MADNPTFFIELVDSAGDRHWSDVITSDSVESALQDAAGFCDCADDGMTFRAYPVDLDSEPAATLDYDSEVVY